MRFVLILISCLSWATVSAHAQQEAAEVKTPSASLGSATSEFYDYITDVYEKPFFTDGEAVKKARADGVLVPIKTNEWYDVITPAGEQVVRPIVQAFLERLSRQYITAAYNKQRYCGKLIVVRGFDVNRLVDRKHRESLHASRAAVDIVTPKGIGALCLNWLEQTLLNIEREGRVDISQTSELVYDQKLRGYHVFVFTKRYEQWLKENS